MKKSGVNSLYIHIPFCKKRCSYCDFCSYVPVENELDKYIEFLMREFLLWKEKVEEKGIKTIYIGGGTPSLLKPIQVEKILNEWANANTLEISIETNPESLNEDFLNSLYLSGATRISLGVQTFKDEFLKLLGRVHSSSDARRALEMVKKYPFSLSLDLIYGIPGQALDDFFEDLNSAMDFSPEHLSAYILEPSQKTEMDKLMEKVDDQLVADMFLLLCRFMRERGYNHYELSNFAKQGYECIHNFNYWKMGFYAGCGASSASYLPSGFLGKNPVRTKNLSDLKTYFNSIQRGCFPFEEIEEITPEKQLREMLMLGLRTSQGVTLSSIEKFLGKRTSALLKRCASLDLEVDTFSLRFKEEKWFLFNSIVSDLFYFLEGLEGSDLGP